MNVILTGVTGTLGSKVLHELLEQKFDELDRIYLLVRSKYQLTPAQRVENMLQSDFTPSFVKEGYQRFSNKITVVDADQILEPHHFIQKDKKNFFIHSAGYVNLTTDPTQKEAIFNENFEFTKAIFNAYASFIDKFIYISTAFSNGNEGGLIDNDYLSKKKMPYRNDYEASKNASEHFVKKEGAEKKIDIQILRPSVLGGNIFGDKFFISKYMVFYLFAKFFYKIKSDDSVRIEAQKDTALNIIPTDYAAKVIVKVFDQDIEQLNIVHSTSTPLVNGITKILETVGFKNFSIIDQLLSNGEDFETRLEQLYYNTIGTHLSPYLTSKPQEWDTTLLEKILPIPKYDLEQYLVDTIEFAKNQDFKNQRW